MKTETENIEEGKNMEFSETYTKHNKKTTSKLQVTRQKLHMQIAQEQDLQ